MADPKTISASKVAFYRGCPLACYFRYEYRDKNDKKLIVPISPPLAFGVEMHYMADQLYKKKEKGKLVKGVPKWADVDKCIGMWGYRWRLISAEKKCRGIPVKFSSEGEKWMYYWDGVKILKGFYNKMITLPWPAETETRKDSEIGGEKVMAKIDRLDLREENGDLQQIISDYKTDRKSPIKSTFLLHRLPQFTLYSYVHEKNTGIRPHLSLLHLRSGKAFKTRRNNGDYEYLEAIIKDTADSIRKDRFVPFFGFHCNMCDYRDYPCREYGMGVDGKLKALEESMKTAPEIADWLSFDVEQKSREPSDIFDNILANLPKSKPWIGKELEKIFSENSFLKRTLEETSAERQFEFINAMKNEPATLLELMEDDPREPENFDHN